MIDLRLMRNTRNSSKKFASQPMLSLVLAGILILYLIQCLSPLRLNTDSVKYLQMAQSASIGEGFTVNGNKAYLPIGYSAVLSFLHMTGVAKPFIFVLVNIIFLYLGYFLFYRIALRSLRLNAFEATLVLLPASLSIVALKHVVITVSEPFFFFISMATLFTLDYAQTGGKRRGLCILFAIGLALTAINIRTIGIALLPPIVFVAINAKNAIDLTGVPKRKMAFLIFSSGLIVLLLAMLAFKYNSEYMSMILGIIDAEISAIGWTGAIVSHLTWKIGELSQVYLNVPASRIPSEMLTAYYIIGAAFCIVALRGLWICSRKFRYLELYTITYSVIVLAWHYHDPRFWMPVIPLLIMYLLIGFRSLEIRGVFQKARVCWLMIYCIMGIAAFGHSTHLTFAGRDFGNYYGDGTYRETYDAALNGGDGLSSKNIVLPAYRLLVDYEPLASQNKP